MRPTGRQMCGGGVMLGCDGGDSTAHCPVSSYHTIAGFVNTGAEIQATLTYSLAILLLISHQNIGIDSERHTETSTEW